MTLLCHYRVERMTGNQLSGNQVILILVVILNRLDAQECQAQNQSGIRQRTCGRFLPTCVKYTAIAIVKLLKISTAVLTAPSVMSR